MAEIFEFKRSDGDKPHHRKSDAPITQPKTRQDIFQDTFEDVMGDWQRYAAKNKLNEYIISKLPLTVVGPEGTNYVNDLNAISQAEQNLKMMIAVFSPGTTFNNQYGWMAAFHRGKEIFSTPADMVSEALARSLNVVLYVAFSANLRTLGRE